MRELNEVLITKEYRLEEHSDNLQESSRPLLPKGAVGILHFDVIQEGDRLNQNKRVYPWNTLSESASTFKREILSKEVVPGFDGHPVSEEGHRAAEVAVILTNFDIDDQNKRLANGQFLIPDTAKGRDVLSLARLKVPLGVSSRAQGTVQEESGQSVVQKDLRLKGWDLVLNPSVNTARMTSLQESKMPKSLQLPEIVDLAWLKENAPEIVKAFNTKNLMELRKATPELYNALITEAIKLSKNTLVALAEVEVSIREEEIREAAERPLLGRIQNLTESLKNANNRKELTEATQGQIALLQEELETTKRSLQEQTKANRANTAILEEVRAERARSAVKAAVLEATQDHPLAELLQVSVLGTNRNKGGVAANKALTEAYSDVVYPETVEDALKAVRKQKALLEHTQISTQRGTPRPEGTGDFDDREARLSGAVRNGK